MLEPKSIIPRTNRGIRVITTTGGGLYGLPEDLRQVTLADRSLEAIQPGGIDIEITDPPTIVPEDLPLIQRVSRLTNGYRLTMSDDFEVYITLPQAATLFR